MVDDSSFAKTICSICYEDLNPIVDDLHSISICGHVFHGLCLQQWFEYCSNSRKYSCPVCKQICSEKDSSRLYFQSLGGPADSVLPAKTRDCHEEDPEALRVEVRRLERKVSGLSSALESQGKEVRVLIEQVSLCKEQAQKDAALRDEAFKQKESLQKLLNLKSEELVKSSVECSRLQERNMALAKELASFKLVSDLDLDEDEILKLASLGNGDNNKDTIDVLKKSLVMRNRSYKELIAKCNALGRGEARSSQKLEKAQQKIEKLKVRLQELETAAEAKDNEALRALKSLNKTSSQRVEENKCSSISNSTLAMNISLDLQGREAFSPLPDSEPLGVSTNHLFPSRTRVNHSCSRNLEGGEITSALDHNHDACFMTSRDHSKPPEAILGSTNSDVEYLRFEGTAMDTDVSSPICDAKKETVTPGTSNLGSGVAPTTGANKASSSENMVILIEDTERVEPILNIKKESSFVLPNSKPGDRCFSGGLLGPDGSSRHLGKWCKRGRNNEGSGMPAGSSSGDLIAVGADGRGGRIKVLKSIHQPLLDDRGTSTVAKRCKYGGKSTEVPSQGCLQIEHFFGRAGH